MEMSSADIADHPKIFQYYPRLNCRCSHVGWARMRAHQFVLEAECILDSAEYYRVCPKHLGAIYVARIQISAPALVHSFARMNKVRSCTMGEKCMRTAQLGHAP